MSTSTPVPKQIPLRFGSYQQIDFQSYIPGENREAINILQNVANNQTKHHVYIWGNAGSGKSHLLQASCKLASEAQLQVAYVPLEHIAEFSPEMLHDLGMLDLVCVDALDHITGQRAWQQALVWLYNELRDNGHSLLMAGNLSPQALPLEVEDLRSRLGWDLVFQIKPPTDDIKIDILKQTARNRAFELPDDVIDYLINRVDRDLSSLLTLLDKIDEVSLAEQRKITIPFIRTVIDLKPTKS